MTDLMMRQDAGGAATLSLNRPDKLNALNVELFAALEAEVTQLERQTDTVGLVILRGAGRCFSAGHDLADISTGSGRRPRTSRLRSSNGWPACRSR